MKLFLNINENMQKLCFKVAAILNIYVKFLISEIKLKVLNIDVLPIKENITYGRRLMLHYIGTLPFFMVATLKTTAHSVWDL